MGKVELTRTAKYSCSDLAVVRERLRCMQATYVITKQQTDYIYRIYDEASGARSKRIKLRIEDERTCSLYVYNRSAQERDIAFDYYADVDRQLISIFNTLYGEAICIHKEREVWQQDGVEYHLDTVEGVGTIFEIENLRPLQSADNDQDSDVIAFFQDLPLTKIEGSNEDLIGGERDPEAAIK